MEACVSRLAQILATIASKAAGITTWAVTESKSADGRAAIRDSSRDLASLSQFKKGPRSPIIILAIGACEGRFKISRYLPGPAWQRVV
jgi:hypothetical protein